MSQKTTEYRMYTAEVHISMANQNSKVFNIDLKGELITTQNKNIIKQFTGFKERNCLVANNSLKGFKKNNTPFIYDDNGNYYSLENNQFKINGVVEKTVATNSPFIVKTEIPVTYENLNNVIWAVPYASGTKEYKIIQTSSSIYIYAKTGSQWVLQETHSGIFKILTSKRCLVFSKISTSIEIIVIYNGNIFYKTFLQDAGFETDEGINFTIKNKTIWPKEPIKYTGALTTLINKTTASNKMINSITLPPSCVRFCLFGFFDFYTDIIEYGCLNSV